MSGSPAKLRGMEHFPDDDCHAEGCGHSRTEHYHAEEREAANPDARERLGCRLCDCEQFEDGPGPRRCLLCLDFLPPSRMSVWRGEPGNFVLFGYVCGNHTLAEVQLDRRGWFDVVVRFEPEEMTIMEIETEHELEDR